MKSTNIDRLIQEIHSCIDRHNPGAAGLYARRKDETRINEYGCADAAMEEYAERYMAMMMAIDYENDRYFNDLHSLFGAVCALAELQAALPGRIMTAKPLRLVLDRRPFI